MDVWKGLLCLNLSFYLISGSLGHDTEDLSRSLPGRSTGSLAFSGFLHNPGRSRDLVDTGYRPRWPALRCFPFSENNFQINGKIVFSQFSGTFRVSMTETLQYGIRTGYLFRCRFICIAFSYLTDEFLLS